MGYQTEAGDWLMVARSASVKPTTVTSNGVQSPSSANANGGGSNAATGLAAAAGGLGLAATVSQKPSDAATTASPATAFPSTQGTTKTVKVHSRNNALMFNEEQLHHIEHNVASTHYLDPAVYTLQIKDGVFNYDSDDAHPGEPFVLLWIHGGTVINKKTNVPVSSTWTTLNGYEDSLILDVREPATLCAFFVDTYPDDNIGEITLTVTKH